MSITSSVARIQYTLSGAAQTLAVPFKFVAGADLTVVSTVAGVDTTLALNTNYTVTLDGVAPNTGKVIMAAGVSGDVITIYRNAAIQQPTSFVSNDRFPATTQETGLDRLTMMIQQLDLRVNRSLRIPVAGNEATEMALASRKNKLTGFDNNGDLALTDAVSAFSPTGTVLEVSSYTALRAASVSGVVTGFQARGAGRASVGDGGDGLWVYNSASAATDDNGTVLQPSVGSGRWIRVITGAYAASWFTSLNLAIAAIGATTCTLEVATAQTLTGNLTIPATMTLSVGKQGTIALAGFTLTINGFLNAGFYQVFSGSGTAAFGAGVQGRDFLPHWWGAKGDAATDCGASILAAATAANGAGGGRVFMAAGTYLVAAAVEIPSNVTVEGVGYGACIQSSQAGTFAHFRNAGWTGGTVCSNITVRGLRFRRTNALAGNEGPYDGGLLFRKCSKLLVENCIFESSMTGVQFEGCTDYEARGCIGYSNGDLAVRVNTYAGTGSATRGIIADCWAHNSGYALDGTTPVAEPSGPIGDGFLCTQSDVAFLRCGVINSRHNAFETGGDLVGLLIDGFYCLGTISGRSLAVLLADLSYSTIRNVTFELHNGATAGTVYVTTGSSTEHHISIDGVTLVNDYTFGTNVFVNAVNINANASFITVKNVSAHGAGAFTSGSNSTDVTIQNCSATGANGAGFTPGATPRLKMLDCVAFNCGNDTVATDQANRSGFYIVGCPGASLANCRAYDTRAGGARTQLYGFYVSSSASIELLNCSGLNNVTNTFAKDGGTVSVTNLQQMPLHLPGAAGAVSDASFFGYTPPDGAIALDTTNFKIYARFGGAWKATAALT